MMGTGTGIVTSNGGAGLFLDTYSINNSILISTDGLTSAQSFIDMTPTSVQIATTNRISLEAPTVSILGSANTYTNGLWVHETKELQLTSATVQDIATYSLSNNQMMTIRLVGNAICTSPNRTRGENMFAVFEKYGGTIYQVSTTDTSAKDTFGDGTEFTIDTDGSLIRIRATNGGGLTTNFVVRYDYIIT